MSGFSDMGGLGSILISMTSGLVRYQQAGWPTSANSTFARKLGAPGLAVLETWDTSASGLPLMNYGTSNQLADGLHGYDAAGNLAIDADTGNSYLYDADGRICAVKAETGFGVTVMTGYVYNAEGKRVAKGPISIMSCDPVASGLQTASESDYVLGASGEQLTEMGNVNTTWVHTNIFASGELIGTCDVDGLHFYANDWLGNRRVQTDYEGVVEQTCTNLPYGDGETCGPTPSEDLYAGLERDSKSGLDHAMYRQYSSVFGQWTTPDPYGGSYDRYNPQSLNRYAYAGNSPFGAVDPSGLDDCSWDPYGVFGCLTLGTKVANTLGWSSDTLSFSIPFIDELPIPITPLTGFATLLDDLGQSFGWWGGGSSFHGNVAASQSGKNVPGGPNNGSYSLLQQFECAIRGTVGGVAETTGGTGGWPRSWDDRTR